MTPFEWTAILGRPLAKSRPLFIPGVDGARVLVTGAGGFIGSALVRLLAESGAGRIVLLDICEQSLFEIAAEMTARGYGARCVVVLGSVCDRALLAETFAEHRPELVIHAAALKHVPLMEMNPLAALATNALGTWNVARAAEEHGARQMLLISTDKAVAPHSIMGAAKRIAELVMLAPSAMRKCAVRLVNVIGSPGSVGPLFAEQIARGGPVTVTHREARRYFLTLAEVVRLLSGVVAEGRSGLLVPEVGEAVLIAELARRMVAASGREVPVVFTEQRPGDKLDEAVIGPDERVAGVARSGLRCVESPRVTGLDASLRLLETAVAIRDAGEALRIVRTLVPDYVASSAVLRSIGAADPVESR